MAGWPWVSREVRPGEWRTGPWKPWESTSVRAVVAVAWTACVWWFTGSVLLAALAAGLAWWVWKATD
ncbi:MAG TPA: hypothetical protein VFX70_19210 [Mycobacteriales bacterium]|nr:hypothetical protein [Mycobacteriales bacterium]